jgi:hypothetical protein
MSLNNVDIYFPYLLYLYKTMTRKINNFYGGEAGRHIIIQACPVTTINIFKINMLNILLSKTIQQDIMKAHF